VFSVHVATYMMYT